MYINMFMLPWSWECVRHHDHTHQHTQRRTPTHTTKHTNKTKTTHPHTPHTHTLHIHTPHTRTHTPHSEKEQTCQDLKDGELCLIRAYVRGVSGRYWRANRDIPLSMIPSGSLELTFFWSSIANDWRNQQHVVLDFTQTSKWAGSLTQVNCTWKLHMWRWIVFSLSSIGKLIWQFSASIVNYQK